MWLTVFEEYNINNLVRHCQKNWLPVPSLDREWKQHDIAVFSLLFNTPPKLLGNPSITAKFHSVYICLFI